MKSIKLNYLQLCLIPVCILEYLIGNNPSLSLIAWVTPLLWLTFFHYTKPIYAIFFAVICLTLIYATQHNVNILQGISFHITNLIFAFTYLLPFLVNRLLYNRIPTGLKWLLLPLCGVTVEYLMSLTSNGTWGSVGYTQTNIYLLQVLSITGIYGIVFIIYLNAALLFALISPTLNKKMRINFTGLAIGVLLITFGFGYIRLNTLNQVTQKVKVMGLTFQGESAWPWFRELVWEGKATIHKQKNEISVKSNQAHQYYLQETQKAIHLNQPKWVIWNEASLLILKADFRKFVQVNSSFAKKNQVFFGVTYFLAGNEFPQQKGENHLSIFAPDGKMIYDYQKNKPVDQMEPAVASTSPPQVFTVGNIKFAGAICADFDYPQLIRKIRLANVVFAPSADWPGIKDLHALMANARAIENGFALFRITSSGKSTLSDSKGRILNSQYHLKQATQLLVTDVPVDKSKSLYALVGDLFSWLCIAGLIAILLYAVIFYPKIN